MSDSRRPRVVLGVSGGIAAYKACELLRRFTESGHEVTVIPTPSALKFVGTATWEALSGRPDNAAQVLTPTNSKAAAVGTTVTSWPAPCSRRKSSHALYAAMPPDTPRTMRRGALFEVTRTGSSGRLETRLGVLVNRSVRVDVDDP